MPKYHTRMVPNSPDHQNLAAAILKAWKEPSYKDELLTFPKGWEGMTKAQRDARIEGTRMALHNQGVSLDKPVVLRPDQFPNYKMEAPDEIVFVLPEVPPSGSTLKDVESAMNAHSLGV
jgi:hypothetical protein